MKRKEKLRVIPTTLFGNRRVAMLAPKPSSVAAPKGSLDDKPFQIEKVIGATHVFDHFHPADFHSAE